MFTWGVIPGRNVEQTQGDKELEAKERIAYVPDWGQISCRTTREHVGKRSSSELSPGKEPALLLAQDYSGTCISSASAQSQTNHPSWMWRETEVASSRYPNARRWPLGDTVASQTPFLLQKTKSHRDAHSQDTTVSVDVLGDWHGWHLFLLWPDRSSLCSPSVSFWRTLTCSLFLYLVLHIPCHFWKFPISFQYLQTISNKFFQRSWTLQWAEQVHLVPVHLYSLCTWRLGTLTWICWLFQTWGHQR